jgi:hypothetical protein
MRETLLAALVLAASSSARASEAVVATDVPASKPTPIQTMGSVGFLAGVADVGDTGGASIGVSGGLGLRRGDVMLRGTFDFYKTGDSGDNATRRGRGMRYGGALRYAFVTNNPRSNSLVEFWGEVGAGMEHVEWRGGGVVDRPSGELGIGYNFGGRYGDRRYAGGFMAIRTFVAPPPSADAMATCAGPCTSASKPGADFSTFFELGFHWGR